MKLFEGVRVLDLSRMLAGPYGSMLLADMGAEVIKIEDPDGGDPMRIMGPPFLPDGESAYFLAINRNKKSLALDLSRDRRPRRCSYDLVRQSDVVWENFRPGIMDRLGLAYSKLWSLNQRIIVCSVSAYGQDGPYRDWPAFDLALQAMGGAMSVTGEAGGRPVRMGLPMADLAGGMFGAFSIAGALFRRARDRARALTSTSRCSTVRSRSSRTSRSTSGRTGACRFRSAPATPRSCRTRRCRRATAT